MAQQTKPTTEQGRLSGLRTARHGLARLISGDDENPGLSARGYLAAWRLLKALPAAQVYPLAALVADSTTRRRGLGVRRLELNLSQVGVSTGAVPAMSRAGMRSYVRYWAEMFRLPIWSPEQIRASVRVIGDEPVREALAQGRGVVMALAHQGNWDLAGAWACLDLAPVSTVAEKLEPPELYQAFLDFRRELGMTVYGVGEPGLIGSLASDLKRGHIVPLLADRDLAGNGVEAQLCGHPARVASGPAVLADLTGAALVPVTICYEAVRVGDTGWPESGYRTVITFHPEVVLASEGTRHDRVRAGVDGYIDALGAGIAAKPEDWHMLQPVFTEIDYPEQRRAARRARKH